MLLSCWAKETFDYRLSVCLLTKISCEITGKLINLCQSCFRPFCPIIKPNWPWFTKITQKIKNAYLKFSSVILTVGKWWFQESKLFLYSNGEEEETLLLRRWTYLSWCRFPTPQFYSINQDELSKKFVSQKKWFTLKFVFFKNWFQQNRLLENRFSANIKENWFLSQNSSLTFLVRSLAPSLSHLVRLWNSVAKISGETPNRWGFWIVWWFNSPQGKIALRKITAMMIITAEQLLLFTYVSLLIQ